MLTQFIAQTSKQTVKSVFHFEKWKKAINEVNEMLDARIRYNTALKDFFLKGSLKEIESFFRRVVPGFHSSWTNKDKLECGKKSIIKDIEADLASYEKIKKIISKKRYNQEMIDELYFLLSKEYEVRKVSENHSVVTEEMKETVYEMRFLKEMLDKVDPLIGETAERYRQDYKFDIIHAQSSHGGIIITVIPQTENQAHLLHKYPLLEYSCFELLKKIEKLEKIPAYLSAIEQLTNELLDLSKRIAEKRKEYNQEIIRRPADIWHIYCNADKDYYDVLESFQQLEKHPLLSSGTENLHAKVFSSTVSNPRYAKKRAKRAQKKLEQAAEKIQNISIVDTVSADYDEASNLAPLETEPAVLAETPSENILAAVTVTQDTAEKKDRNEFIDLFALRARAWKEEVAQCKKEKQKAIDAKNKEERLYFEQQKKHTEYLLKNKGEDEYKNAYELLTSLNENNRGLIARMFASETPHCQIRYQEIESLFGTGADGKLPGTITSVSGSHRKICIQSNSIGFFDEFYADDATGQNLSTAQTTSEVEEKTRSDVVVGGVFKAHKDGQSGSKLPRVAIKMVCATLEKVGITAVNIARFNDQNANQNTKPKLMEVNLKKIACKK